MMFCCVVLESRILLKLILCLHSGDETDTDSEVEDRVDGIKSWLTKNKTSAKTLSDEGSLKSTRFVLTSIYIMTDNHVRPCGNVQIQLRTFPAFKRLWITLGRL